MIRVRVIQYTGFIGSLKVLEKSLNLNVPYFEIFACYNFEESILVKFGISPLLGYSSLDYLKTFPLCITYNLFVLNVM